MNNKAVFNDINIVDEQISVASTSDVLLLRRIAVGDELAFSELYQRYYRQIYNYVLRLIHEPREAEDLLQEIFLGVWRGASRYRGEAQVTTWLYRIAHYQSVSWLRRHRPVVSFISVVDTHNRETEQITHEALRIDEVKKAINSLSVKHRSVLELAYVHGMAYKEIAKVVGCPVGTVKSRLSYAIRSLSHKLKDVDLS